MIHITLENGKTMLFDLKENVITAKKVNKHQDRARNLRHGIADKLLVQGVYVLDTYLGSRISGDIITIKIKSRIKSVRTV